MAIALFVLGSLAFKNKFLEILKVNETVFYAMLVTGTILMATAAIGCAAVTSKNEMVSFIVR